MITNCEQQLLNTITTLNKGRHMNLESAILTLLLRLSAHSPDEDVDAMLIRMSQVSTSIVRVAEAFTCSGPYSSVKECVKRWPGNVEELSALLLSIGHQIHCFNLLQRSPQ